MHRLFYRTASTLITLFGSVANVILTIQLVATWRSLKWEQETEWEGLGEKWQLHGLKLIWALLCLYFSSSAAVSIVGLYGVLKSKASHVRFYRDYSIADFAFSTTSTLLASYAAFLGPARAGICEEFSHHPELMRDMLEMGLNLENCELWLERAVFAMIAVMFVIMVVRLHFLLAVSNYYSQLVRWQCHHHHRSPSNSSPSSAISHPLQRIVLVPTAAHPVDLEGQNSADLVYAAVPRASLPKELQAQATEAWVSTTSSNSNSGDHWHSHRSHHHRRYHHRNHSSHHRRSCSREATGLIKLDIAPGEGLLPAYALQDEEAKV
ncbi:hypothetical protein CPB83DRAFT_842656 [Crepidotus variabilis]|uniref:Uncharacterized protein n=1 Tax=Crepidotus variabilis TaxID=179855 RepID=A0A9P6ETZ9_9AGAR|nr:hypothetical protein CPB83DRAFT_842656 [Crepidotus variabilis]